METIAEHGVQGATITRIAKGAGITPAALYAHFENRQAILLAALDVVYEQVFDSFYSSHSPDPVQRLREICEHHAQKVRNQDKTSHAHLFLEFVASAPEEGLRDALREKERATASYLASIVEELKDCGSLPPEVEPELIAWLIAGWAWTGDVASSMGVSSVWAEKVSPRLLDLILGTLRPAWQGGASTPQTGDAGPYSGPTPASAATEAGKTAAGPLGANGACFPAGAAYPPNGVFNPDGLPNGAVFTVPETAAILKVPLETVEQMVAEGELPSLQVRGEPRITRRALLAFLRGLPPEELDKHLAARPGGQSTGDRPA